MKNSRERLEAQVKEMIASNVEMYLNGVYDAGYEPMTREQWKDYVMESFRQDVASGMNVNDMEFRHMQFFGKKNIERLVYEYLNTYADVQPYIIR